MKLQKIGKEVNIKRPGVGQIKAIKRLNKKLPVAL